MGNYSESSEWSDIEPIPLNEGTLQPLASIALSDDYLEATAYLRAIMAKNELSVRALDLTADIIGMNPSHYTVWLYRAKILLSIPVSELPTTLLAELEFLNPLSLKHLKNYQIWQHRQTVISALGQWQQDPPFLEKMLALDSKNYHVWSYRQWMVSHFGLWDEKIEWEFVDKLLDEDVRNNSAWNHRWFIVFGRPDGKMDLGKKDVIEREWVWALDKVGKAPQNESSWNYIRGLLNKAEGAGKLDTKEAIETVKPYAMKKGSNGEVTVRSSYALDVLAMLYAETGQVDEACEVLDMLAEKYDPIRAGYWRYRKRQIRPESVAESASVSSAPAVAAAS